MEHLQSQPLKGVWECLCNTNKFFLLNTGRKRNSGVYHSCWTLIALSTGGLASGAFFGFG